MESELSICIVAYHNYNDILKAVESIESNTSSRLIKIIYIIDNSNFEKTNINRLNFEKELEYFPNVKYLSPERNLGFGKGHNYVLGELKSKYHAIVNPDILITPHTFEKIISFMELQGVGMCIPRITNEEGKLQSVYRREITVMDLFVRILLKNRFTKRFAFHTMQDQDYTKPFVVPFGQGSFLVIKTALFQQLNGFDDRYFMYLEDADLCKRVNSISKLMYCPDATVIHKWQKGSHKNLSLMKLHIHSMILYFQKWGLKLL